MNSKANLLEKVNHLWKCILISLENGGFENNETNLRGSWNQVMNILADVLRGEDGLNHNIGS